MNGTRFLAASVTGACLLAVSPALWANSVLPLAAAAAQDGASAAASHYDVYVVAGQSNMDGRGTTAELTGAHAVYKQPQPDVLIYYANPANREPLHPTYRTGWQTLAPGFSVPPGFAGSLPSARFGPELSFARTLADADPQRRVALIKVTKGGTNLRYDWKPGSGYLYATLTNIVRLALQDLRHRGAEYTLRGIIWHQGESDVSAGADRYASNLTAFIQSVRHDLAISNLPFVIGELATNKDGAFRAAQLSVSRQVPWVGFAATDGLSTLEGTHFTTQSVLELGKRFARGLERPPMRLNSIRCTGADYLASRATGLGRSPFRLVADAAPDPSLARWDPVATNNLHCSGHCILTSELASGFSRQFCKVVPEWSPH